MDQISKQWDWHSPDVVSGKYVVGRVMGQINWPLGVDQIFSFTGNVSYLESRLSLVDKSLSYVNDRADNEGLVTLVPVGQGHMGGGADWVDWYPESRLDGRTFQFHVWYFSHVKSILESSLGIFVQFRKCDAKVYADRAQNLRRVLLERYWSTSTGIRIQTTRIKVNGWTIQCGVNTLMSRTNRSLKHCGAISTRTSPFSRPCRFVGRDSRQHTGLAPGSDVSVQVTL